MRYETRHSVRARGLTLMEMMVAVVLLVIMIMSFSMVLSQAQRVVSQSETAIRGNASAAAIAQVIRTDIRQASMNGFLCISQTSAATPASLLLFTTAAPTPSKITTDFGSATLAMYGLCRNSTLAGRSILFHKGVVLKNGTTGTDVNSYDMADIQRMDRATLAPWVDGLLQTTGMRPAALAIPPITPGDVTNLWQALANNVSDISISWTDGTVTNGMPNWYGTMQSSGIAAGQNETSGGLDASNTWQTRATPTTGNNYIQYSTTGAAGGFYRALFTHDDQAKWPKAIKVRFSLNDTTRASDQGVYDSAAARAGAPKSYMDYEVICPVSQ